MSPPSAVPVWVPDPGIVLAQLASGILRYAEETTDRSVFRLPYPANLVALSGVAAPLTKIRPTADSAFKAASQTTISGARHEAVDAASWRSLLTRDGAAR